MSCKLRDLLELLKEHETEPSSPIPPASPSLEWDLFSTDGEDTAPSDASETLRSKISDMQTELRGKQRRVSDLESQLTAERDETSVLRRSLCSQHEEALSKLRSSHADAVRKSDVMRANVEASNSELQNKSQALQEALKKIISDRPRELDASHRRAAEELENAQKNWRRGEEKRLVELAKKKVASIKEQAVRALEPELHRMVAGNKVALAELRTAHADATRKRRREVEREVEDAVAEDGARVERSLQAASDEVVREECVRLKEARRQQEDELEALREEKARKMQAQNQNFELRWQKRGREMEAQLSELRNGEQVKVQELVEQHERRIAEFRRHSVEEDDRLRTERRHKLEEWQKETLRLLRGKLESAQGDAVEHLQSKLEKETSSAMAKLEAHAEKERAEFVSACDAKLQKEQENASGEVKKAQEDEAKSRAVYFSAVERQTAAEAEAAKAGAELHELRRRTEESLRRSSALEQEASTIKVKLQRHVRDTEQADVERAAARYAEIAAIKEKIRNSKISLKKAEEQAAFKARQSEAQRQADLQAVQKRVNEVIRAKEKKIADLQKQAGAQREATRDRKSLVDQIREKQYV